MSLPLADLRIKVTPETLAWLRSEAASSGCEMGEIARSELHKVALTKIRASMLLHYELESNGLLRDYEVKQGRGRDE